MPRNASGTYTLPTGNPVVSGDIISSTWANDTMGDVASALTASLARDGSGGMTAALRVVDGSVSVPGLGFANETGSGLYRTAAGDVGIAILGNQILRMRSTGLDVTGALSYTGTLTGGTGVVNIGSGQIYKDASGNVGIGTSSPATNLQVVSSADTALSVLSTGTVQSSRLQLVARQTSVDEEWNIVSAGSGLGSPALRFIRGGWTGTPFMTIDSSGNVGIGTSSPTSYNGKVAIAKTASASETVALSLVNSDSATNTSTSLGFAPNVNIDLARITALRTNTGFGGATDLIFKSFNGSTLAERMRIASNGQVLIGTTSGAGAQGNLQVVGSSINTFAVVADKQNATAATVGLSRPDDGIIMWFYRAWSGGGVGTISITSTSTTYNTASDYRLKESITPMTGALAKNELLNPVTYKWKADGSDGQGFIAHELQAVFPDAVTGEKDTVDSEGKPVYQGVDTSFLVGHLVACVKELNAKVAALEAAV